MNVALRSSNSFWHWSSHVKRQCFFSLLRRCCVLDARSGMKSLFDWIIQRKDDNSAFDVGGDASCSDSTFFGSGLRPSLR